MSQEIMNLLSTGGAGVAVTVVTVIFLRFLKEERKELMSDRREERKQFLLRLDDISHRLETLGRNIKNVICSNQTSKDEDGKDTRK